jgi:predicted nucleic acid-binding protein
MILTDTSVIIDYLRGKDAKLLSLLPTLPVAVPGLVRAEILCGANSPKQRASLITLLDSFTQLPFPESLWDTLGDNLAVLRSTGLTVPFQDVVIVTLGLHLDVEVWSRDKHFPDIQKRFPALKLFQEPP